MAKKMRKLLALCLMLVFSISMIATPAIAAGPGGGGPGGSSSEYEWYKVIINGVQAASGQGPAGDVGWLVMGTYTYSVNISGTIMNWRAGNQSGSIDVADYVSIPEGFEVAEGGYTVTSTSVSGTNSQSAMFDNATITVNITALYNPTTGEEIEVPDPTDPPPTDPEPVATKVTVNHVYKVYDIYTGQTTEDGRISTTADATEGDSYTAVAVPSYNGNSYEQTGVSPAMTITTKADAADNVITIEYLRTIDTTPVPVETEVTVKHIYQVYDIYTGQTTEDGRTSSTTKVTEGDSFTAATVTTYGGNAYELIGATPALTISIAADAAENVIEITYLRTVDSTPVNYTPVVKVEKSADKTVYEAGQTITWTITVTNISEYTAYNVVVTDPLTNDNWTIAALAAGAGQTFTATTENAMPGSVKNTVAVSWDDNDEIPDDEEPNEIKQTSDEEIVSVNDPIPENYTPVLSVVKTADKEVYKEGESVIWTITVKNVSDYPAYNVVVVDELAKGYWTIEALAPGAEEIFTATMENVAAGSVKNTVVVTWNDGDDIPDGEEDEVTEIADEEVVTVEEPEDFAPVISVDKRAEKLSYEIGETIIWTITVKNVSAYAAYDIAIVDELTGDGWNIEVLEPGTEQIFTVTTKAETAGTIKNVVVVNWNDDDEIPDEEETDEPKQTSDEQTVEVKEPDPTELPTEDPTEPPTEAALTTAPTEKPNVPAAQNDEIEIPEEDVPLADAPKTGDISGLWVTISGISAAGMILLGRKRKDEEE